MLTTSSLAASSRAASSLAAMLQGEQIKTLQTTLAKIGATIPAAETGAAVIGTGTTIALKQFQESVDLPQTGIPDPITIALLSNAATVTASNQANLSGVLLMDYGIPAAGLTLRLYSIGFGGAATKLVEEKANAGGVYSLSYNAPAAGTSIQVRVVNAQGQETVLSSALYTTNAKQTAHLVAPAAVQPLAAEFTRLAADVQKAIGGNGISNLAKAQETATQQDLTLLNNTTGWDARLLALAASAAQVSASIGLGEDVLYAMLRTGLPTNTAQLALISPATVTAALKKAQQSGIIALTDQDITNTIPAFQAAAVRILTGVKAPGGVSTGGSLLNAAAIADQTQKNAFMSLVLGQPSPGDDFWESAAALKIPAATLSALQLQGKCFYLTLNNLPLSQKIQNDIGAGGSLSQLAEKDYFNSATWQNALTSVAGTGGAAAVDTLVPSDYTGTAADRLSSYTADLARKVRISFPTETVARMVESNTLPLGQSTAPVAAFLKTAASQGYQLGRTPLNAFLKSNSKNLPALSAADTAQLKTLHRLYQLTPSNESLQAALGLGFTSAGDIATAYTRTAFLGKYAGNFPSWSEADLVYRKAQQITSVTFNFFAMAKGLDTNPPIYTLSSSSGAVQDAKNSIIEQFPSMQTLFGSMDFCQCDDCQSVLSPAAYFVDLLEFLRTSGTNGQGYTPLDALIGSVDGKIGSGAGKIPSRRADLAALPLTCANTNTAMPYIDIVNEILEYYICHGALDGGVAYDTGSVTTDDLTAEPQHILPQAYAQLLKADPNFGYPLGLPFDLWLETVRGFYTYFGIPLVQVLEVLRPIDQLELFTDANAEPYYRASTFAEMLGLSPSEYAIFTNTNPLQGWYGLYSYPNETIALKGGTYPAAPPNFSYTALTSAKCLAQYLGLTYKEVTNLVTTGFINPALASISFQFQRFGIDMSDAFSYTGQPGFTALSAADKAAFEASLDALTQQYKTLNPASTFDTRTWLAGILPANYSKKVLVLSDQSAGCDFGTTTLMYADGSPATNLDFLKINLFVRLRKKTGWKASELDRALQLFFATGPGGLPASTDPAFGADFSAAWRTALIYLAHLGNLATAWSPVLGRAALLPLWAPLPVTGNNPLYAQIFLTPAVLNIDPAFDDPYGKFPGSPTDPLSLHQSGIQGALGLSASDVAAILADAGASADQVNTVVNGQPVQVPAFTLANLSLLYRYNLLASSLNLSITDFIALKGLAVDLGGANPGTNGLNPFALPTGVPLNVLADDLLFTQTAQFVDEAGKVAASGFTMEDLRYLLLHQFDPVGEYSVDQDSLITLAQSMASGLLQIQNAEAVPSDLNGLSDDLIQQKLSGLFPAPMVNSVTGLLTNLTTFAASQSGVAPGTQIDPTAFATYPELGFSYDAVSQVQTVTYKGVLLDWKKTQLQTINNTAFLAGLFTQIQQQAKPAFDAMIGNITGLWASLARYEATRSLPAMLVFPAVSPDPAFATGYDPQNQIQWAVYRGVLTPTALTMLTAVNNSPDLAALLASLQHQSLPAFDELLGYLLGLWTATQTYEATQTAVAAANAIDPAALAAYPQLQVSYDPVTQIQTLAFTGILTTTLEATLVALLPGSGVFSTLLQNIRAQMLAFFTAQATNWITVQLPATWDSVLDASAAPYAGLDAPKMLKTMKAELIKIFSPLTAQSLSSKLVVQSLVSNLASDPSLTGSLLTEINILSDPGKPGRSLQGAFLALGVQGITASFYGSADQSGAALGGGPVTVETADMADPANPGPGTADSAHFEGYLQTPTDGPYRFFAELANTGATVVFRIDAPASAALVANPILSYMAVKAGDECSQFVTLQGGVAYHFTIDFTNLGVGGGASLLVQGETQPKGALDQLLLYPQSAINEFIAARTLLGKSLQLVQGANLDQTEVAYFSAHPDQFSGFRLSAIPTQPVTGQPAKARSLFAQFLMMADYADLKKGPAGGTDQLIDVFQGVGQVFTEPVNSGASNQNTNAPWTILGNLTRRDPQVVRDVATQFGLLKQTVAGTNLQVQAQGDFANNKGIRRIWSALQAIQTIGLPVASVVRSTQIVAPSRLTAATDPGPAIAGDLRNAVRAQYSDDVWRPVAKSVFDPLRQKKRDALVAYIVRELQLETEEQLFEYFLVDPAMEPVVQTSRLRLALSSVQTFVQRCLLNLENGHSGTPDLNISPSAIDADWWEWMKRYRVWEANREIFLYPENWMVPELRLDTTDLFQTMIGDLLKGDITSDLVESAFQKYLQGLELRARLDIVATYLDQGGPTDATDQLYADNILHVLGRTHSHPHEYFYRTYGDGLWSGWVQVTAPIDGDHIAIAIWRNRLNVFWVSFNKQAQPAQPPSSFPSGPGTITSLDFGTLASNLATLAPQMQVQVQLHWCEYFQGVWSKRLSSDINQYAPVLVPATFDISQVYIHVTKGAPDTTFGIDGPISIHLDFQDIGTYSFIVTNKNSYPDFGTKYGQPAVQQPYLEISPDKAEYDGSGGLISFFQSGKVANGCPTIENILQNVNNYALVACSNPVTTPFLPPTNAQYQETGPLVSPFFYKDTNSAAFAGVTADESTFFVQPSVTEMTVTTWPGWVVGVPHPTVDVNRDPGWSQLKLVNQVPATHVFVIPKGDPALNQALFTVGDRTDAITAASNVVNFGTRQIGATGALNSTLLKNEL